MNQQYETLFSLPSDLYTSGAPVLISAAHLLRDRGTGALFVGLNLQNLGAKEILAVQVTLTLLDPADRVLGATVQYDYMDLRVPRGGFIGNECLLPVGEQKTRGFVVNVSEVIFADKTIWGGSNDHWEPLPARIALEEALEPELAKQYRLTYAQQCRYSPVRYKGLYMCSCGAVSLEEEACFACGTKQELLTDSLIDRLNQETQARLAQEKLEREAEAQRKAEALRLAQEQRAEKKKCARKRGRIVAICAAALAVLAVAAVIVVPKFLEKNVKTPLEHLKVGMPPEEVEEIFGEPDREDYNTYIYDDVEVLGRTGELYIYFFGGDAFSGATFKTWIEDGGQDAAIDYYEECCDYLSDIYGKGKALAPYIEVWYEPIYYSRNRKGILVARCNWAGAPQQEVTSADMLGETNADGWKYAVTICWSGQEAVEND